MTSSTPASLSDSTAPTALSVAVSPRRSHRASWAQRQVIRALEPLRQGSLRLILPDGSVHRFGSDEPTDRPPSLAPATAAEIRIHDSRVFARCVASGDLGFAEAYVDGDWSSPDLTAVLAWFIRNADLAPTLSGSRGQGGWGRVRRWQEWWAQLRCGNSPRQAPRNVSAHYDLSNAFFRLFLGPSMMYSAASWSGGAATLEQAQDEKNDRLCRWLQLKPWDHVLEIGSGWGGWALHAARHYGCRVTSLTLSRQQADYAKARVAEAGLQQQVDIAYRDFRDEQGRFDKLVSIEMMEALGHRYQPEFCAAVNRLLRPGGLAALQFITVPDARYAQLRRGVDFIQRHIFPGTLLLSLSRVNHLMQRHGGWQLHQLEDLGTDYARTLACWQEAFQREQAAVQALGLDARFGRKWDYYFSYCRAAFAFRHISVVQTLYTQPNNLCLA